MLSLIAKGRIARPLELKTTSTGKTYVSFAIASNRKYARDKVDFLTVKAWGKTAEFIVNYFQKGQEILIQGDLMNDTWETKEGQKRDWWFLNADNVDFCGGKGDFQNDTESAPTSASPALIPDSEDLFDEDDDDKPF